MKTIWEAQFQVLCLGGPTIARPQMPGMDCETRRKHEPPCLLVVEDDDGLRALACAILTQEGYKVLATGSPVEAMHILDHGPDDIRLLITDICMPGMTGLTLGNWVRVTQPEVKLLYVSAHADSVPQELRRAGVFLPKPFTRQGLAEKVRCLLSRAESRPPEIGPPQ